MNEMDVITCPVCNSQAYEMLRKHRSHTPVFKDCFLIHCRNCGMVYTAPMPDDHSLALYNAGYFTNAHGGLNTNPLTTAFISAINLLRVLYVESYAVKNNCEIKKVLEVGPGGGHFARHWLQRHNDNDRYTGVESDKICYPNLESIGVKIYSDVNELPEEQLVDLVVISHVLEHTSHPAAFIKDCTKLLSPGGILFVEVPCKDYEHKDMDEPHLLFFDKKPMELFFTKQGFTHIQTSYHGNTIKDLKKPVPIYQKIFGKGRNFLLRKGVLFPFSATEKGLENVSNPLERACVKPFKAHIEQEQPSWWLRAIGIKK
jgi:SAM-dependent methyltransferase